VFFDGEVISRLLCAAVSVSVLLALVVMTPFWDLSRVSAGGEAWMTTVRGNLGVGGFGKGRRLYFDGGTRVTPCGWYKIVEQNSNTIMPLERVTAVTGSNYAGVVTEHAGRPVVIGKVRGTYLEWWWPGLPTPGSVWFENTEGTIRLPMEIRRGVFR
jgi:hypothetical protein